MQAGAITDGLAAALGAVAGLRVYDYLAGAIVAPAAVVVLESIDYDATMVRGMDRASFKVHLLVAQASAQAARDALDPYLEGAGAGSVKAAIEAAPTLGGAAEDVQVQGATISAMAVGGIDYLTATFAVDVIA